MYSVTITPRGRSAYTLPCESPTFRNNEEVGWLDGEVTLDAPLGTNRLAWVRDAQIAVHGPFGDLYRGFVKSANGTKLTCAGHLAYLLDATGPRPGLYCDNDTSPWTARRNLGVTPEWDAVGAVGSQLLMMYHVGSNWTTGASHGLVYAVPAGIKSVRISGSWSRLSARQRLDIHSGVALATDAANGEGIQWSAASFTNVATGAFDVTVTQATDFDYILLNIVATGADGPAVAVGAVATFDSIRVYAAGISTINPTTVIADCLSKLPSGMLGDTDIATDATELVPFVKEGTERDRINGIRAYVGGVFRGEVREGVSAPVAVYKTRPTVPAYSFVEDGELVNCDGLTVGTDLDNLFSAVRVFYTFGSSNVRKFVDCYDTDPTHYLVKIGRCYGGTYGPKWAPAITAQTTSAAMATTAGNLYLATVGADAVNGTVTIIDDRAGYVLPGELVQLTTRDHGTIVARIRDLSATGATRATITLDNTDNAADLVSRAVNKTRSI